MSTCNHEEYDDYFEICTECKATKEQILAELVAEQEKETV
jgi:hypothetical protein